MNEQELRAAVEKNGLADWADELLARAEPAIRFASTAKASTPLDVATSKLGGAPDLPAGFVWPRREERPLSFIAQISLSELPPLAAAEGMPSSGLLSFFYDAEEMVYGEGPEDVSGWRVVWHKEVAGLTPQEPPEEIEEDCVFPECGLTPRTSLTLPSLKPDLLPDDEEVWEQYWALLDEVNDGQGDGLHQMLGRPCEIQDPMELDCQMAVSGLSYDDFAGHTDPKRLALEEPAKDWRLLLQIDSDDRVKMMWGDLGMLYYWIRRQDLRAGRFDASWIIMQCS